MTIRYLQTDKVVSVIVNGKVLMIPSHHPNFKEVVHLLAGGGATPEELEALMSIKTAILRLSYGDIRIEGDNVYHKDKLLSGMLVDRLISAVHSGNQNKIDRFMKFANSLYANPSFRVREQLYAFLEKGQNPISENGGFIAFKKVRNNYNDCYTNSIRNAPGDVVSMPREEVDDDPNRTCSAGLHVCNHEYLNHFSGDRVVIVEVMPEDVVSVPVDYDSTKMRTAKYRVLDDVTGQSYDDLITSRHYW